MCTQGSVAFRGLQGAYDDEPWYGDQTLPATQAGTQTTSTKSVFDKILDAVKTGAQAYSDIKNAGSGSPGSAGYVPPPGQPQPSMSNGTKIFIGIGAASFVGGIIYFATRKRKK